MLSAELHGKLGDGTNARDRMEDVLTSNVFGLLRCVAPSELLVPWLSRSRPAVATSPALIGEGINEASIHFWPRLHRRELDVLVLLRSSRGTHVVGVECKYESGKSGASVDTAGNALASDAQTGDQLADYMNALAADAVYPRPYNLETVHRRSLIYLTAHASMPRSELETSLRLRRANALVELYWLPWRELSPLLPREARGPGLPLLLADLRRVLERRGLSTFTGWQDPASLWSPPATERFFRSSRVRTFFASLIAPQLPADATFWRGRSQRGA